MAVGLCVMRVQSDESSEKGINETQRERDTERERETHREKERETRVVCVYMHSCVCV